MGPWAKEVRGGVSDFDGDETFPKAEWSGGANPRTRFVYT
jgi:hypothetical protein